MNITDYQWNLIYSYCFCALLVLILFILNRNLKKKLEESKFQIKILNQTIKNFQDADLLKTPHNLPNYLRDQHSIDRTMWDLNSLDNLSFYKKSDQILNDIIITNKLLDYIESSILKSIEGRLNEHFDKKIEDINILREQAFSKGKLSAQHLIHELLKRIKINL